MYYKSHKQLKTQWQIFYSCTYIHGLVHIHICMYIYLHLCKQSTCGFYVCEHFCTWLHVFSLIKCIGLFIKPKYYWHLPCHSLHDISCANSFCFLSAFLQTKSCTCRQIGIEYNSLYQMRSQDSPHASPPHLLPVSKVSMEALTSAEHMDMSEQLCPACR